jgi:hypothetical protein
MKHSIEHDSTSPSLESPNSPSVAHCHPFGSSSVGYEGKVIDCLPLGRSWIDLVGQLFEARAGSKSLRSSRDVRVEEVT